MPSHERIKVFVLHADPIARAGLAATFGQYPDLEIEDGEDPLDFEPAPSARPRCRADVVVADYANGVALAARAARDMASLKVLVVAATAREWEIRRALERGVRGYVVAGCAPDTLAAGIRAVHRGARHMSPQVAARLAESVSCEPLTFREEQVLRLLASGLSNKAIARSLAIAENTVKSHLKSVFEKLRVQSRTQAVAVIGQRGLLDPERHAPPPGGPIPMLARAPAFAYSI